MPTVECNGADLYYGEAGDGKGIVFLHGAWAGLRFFEPRLRGLSDDLHVVAVDFRGHGRSEKTEAGHTISQYARDVEAFLDALALSDVVLVGWSMGADVTWEYVDQFGTDRLCALVDVDTSSRRSSTKTTSTDGSNSTTSSKRSRASRTTTSS